MDGMDGAHAKEAGSQLFPQQGAEASTDQLPTPRPQSCHFETRQRTLTLGRNITECV